MKGRPNYRAIIEHEEPSKLNVVDEDESLMMFEDVNLKTVVNQIETFDHCLKNAPDITSHFMRAVLQGNESIITELIEKYHLSFQDIIQMRSLDFVVPIDIEDPQYTDQDMKVNIDSYNWNPFHFATAYKRFKILKLFKKLFAHQIDFLWALSLPVSSEIEGVPDEDA